MINEKWKWAAGYSGLVCPVCGEYFYIHEYDTDKFNYCPSCGVKLEYPDSTTIEIEYIPLDLE